MNNRENRNLLAKNWLGLSKPADYFLESIHNNKAVFSIEPLERGFGVTLGNALRRIMLSSLHGIAITAVKIEGVDHEYSTISGVREDVLDIIMNLKSVILSSNIIEKRVLNLTAQGPCQVTAAMLKDPNTGMLIASIDEFLSNDDVAVGGGGSAANEKNTKDSKEKDNETNGVAGTDVKAGIVVVNPSHVICNLEKGAKINIDVYINAGKGYVVAEDNKFEGMPLSAIAVDSIFSPVRRVSYKVENTRIGATTEYDRLQLTVETNGAITPDMALALAAKIMQDQLQVFIHFSDVVQTPEIEENKLSFDPRLLIKVDDLDLSVRSGNCLKSENILYIGDLVKKTEAQMLQTPNFGRKSLIEIKDLLVKMGMRFGMEVQDWPPENIEELASAYDASRNNS